MLGGVGSFGRETNVNSCAYKEVSTFYVMLQSAVYCTDIIPFSATGSVPLQYSEQPTNEVTYFQALSGLNLLPDDLKIFIPLFCAAITQLV